MTEQWAYDLGYADHLRGLGRTDYPLECADGDALKSWLAGWDEAEEDMSDE